MTAPRTALLLTVLAAIGLAARLPHFADRPYWFDEVYQVHVAGAPDLPTLLDRVRAEERNPPGGYLLTRAGLALGGGEWAARLPSLVCGLLCLPAAWAAGRAWVGRSAGLWAAAFCALSPVYVFYSREARVYAPGLLAVWAFVAAAGGFRLRPTPGRAALLAAAAVAAASVQYAGAVVAAVGLLALPISVRRWPDRRLLIGWLFVGLMFSLTTLAWTYSFLRPQTESKGTGSREPGFAENFLDPTDPASVRAFVAGPVNDFALYPVFAGRLGPKWAVLGLAAMGLLAGAALRGALRPRWRFVAVFGLGGVAMFVALAATGRHPFGGIRHCLPLTPGVILLWAAGLDQLYRWATPIGPIVGGAILGMMVLGQWHFLPQKHTHELPPLLAKLRADARPGDAFVAYGPGVGVVLDYYRGKYPWLAPLAVAGLHPRGLPGGAPGMTAEDAVSQALGTSSRVWVVEFPGEAPDLTPLFAGRADAVEMIAAGGVRATLWSRPPSEAHP